MCDEMKVIRKGDEIDEFTVSSEGPIAVSESCIVYSVVDEKNITYALKYIMKDKIDCYNILNPTESFYLMRLRKLVVKNHPEFTLYVMKYCDDNLEMRIKSIKELRGTFSSSAILKEFCEMSVGLFDLHKSNISHCNIKPGNVFVDDGVCKLGNFGTPEKLRLARATLVKEKNNKEIRNYIAPEVFSEQPLIIQESLCDIFSLGAVVYELIELIPLPRDDNFPFNPLQPCIFRNYSRISASVKDLILKMVSTSPQARPTIDDIVLHPEIRRLIESFPLKSLPNSLRVLYKK